MYRALIERVSLQNRINFRASIRAISKNVFAKHILKEPFKPSVSAILNKYNEKILYSSHVENNKKQLSYNQMLLLKSRAEKEEKQKRLSSKPFSVALKYVEEDICDIVSPNVAAAALKKADGGVSSPLMKDLIDNPAQMMYDPEENIRQNEARLQIYSKLKNQQNQEDDDVKTVPKTWMSDYETYRESVDEELDDEVSFGTPDPRQPISRVPCHGCGALLHCIDSTVPGYLPSELFRDQSPATLHRLICQRCHFLKNYNTALNLNVEPEEYIKLLSSLADQKALVILLVDLLDFPCSIWPGLINILGPRRPVFIVGNKVDLLPQDNDDYLTNIKASLEQSVIEAGFSATNIQHTCLISAQTNYGIEELITKLHEKWKYRGDVYLVGCTNVGKSTLFNSLIRSDYCKSQARNIVRRATASIWPGTTLRMLKFPILRPSDKRIFHRVQRLKSERLQRAKEAQLRQDQAYETGKVEFATLIGHIGETFSPHRDEESDPFGLGSGALPHQFVNENYKDYKESRWCHDTPGVVQNDQVINLLTTEELLKLTPKQMITPRIFLFRPGMSLFLAGLGRIDYLNASDGLTRIAVFASKKLPILIVNTSEADELYRECLGTDLLGVPCGDQARMDRWPSLEKHPETIHLNSDWNSRISCGDIVLSSAGWVAVNLPANGSGTFNVWTPERRGIYIRKPSLIMQGVHNLRGKRMQGSLQYHSRPFARK